MEEIIFTHRTYGFYGWGRRENFPSLESFLAHYRYWADTLDGYLTPVKCNEKKVVFVGLDSTRCSRLIGAGKPEGEAINEARICLIVECDDEKVIKELASWKAF